MVERISIVIFSSVTSHIKRILERIKDGTVGVSFFLLPPFGAVDSEVIDGLGFSLS